ncbi:MAG TPA: hypothetical protein VJO53_14480 [Candidatus Acidoferrales bacterium]|nr:hypothetical protein [Candidatus Acidoferrales bacterium]
MTRRTLELAATCVALLIAALAVHSWLASRDEQQRLAATLAAQKQLLDAADAREAARQSALTATLAQIDKLKRAAQTPEEILRDLPKYLPLPQPIALVPAGHPGAAPAEQGTAPLAAASSSDGTSRSGATVPAETPSDLPAVPVAQIPASDLKPLYDYVQDCRACQAQLAAARQDKFDDAARIAALMRERDAAITAAKGGTFWRRLRRNTLWFVVGAGIGAAAARATSKR